MTGKFRGAKVVGDKFKTVEGQGCLFVNSKAYIIKSSVPTVEQLTRVQVVPASVSPSVFIEGLGHVYKGDVIRYTFRERGEYFNRYYRVSEHHNTVRLTEIYRDYIIDCDMHVVRGKFATNAGEVREILSPLTYNETYTLVGNIWENPELEKPV